MFFLIKGSRLRRSGGQDNGKWLTRVLRDARIIMPQILLPPGLFLISATSGEPPILW